MDSQTPGESHVVSQLKEAVDEAVTFGCWSDHPRLADAALHVPRHPHEVDPLMDIAEIEEVALRYLGDKLPGLSRRRVLLIGSGMVGRGSSRAIARLRLRLAYFRNAPVGGEEAQRVRVVH